MEELIDGVHLMSCRLRNVFGSAKIVHVGEFAETHAQSWTYAQFCTKIWNKFDYLIDF